MSAAFGGLSHLPMITSQKEIYFALIVDTKIKLKI